MLTLQRACRLTMLLAAVLSALLCCVATVLWIRGHRVTDRVVWVYRDETNWQFDSSGGEFSLGWQWYPSGYPRGMHFFSYPVPGPVRECFETGAATPHWAGPFAVFTYNVGGKYLAVYGLAPCWAVVLGLAMLPVGEVVTSLLRKRRRRRRYAAGLCTRCGYDLRATPGGCPECGSGRGA